MFNNWQTKYRNSQNSNHLVRNNRQRYTKNSAVTFNLREKYNSIIPLIIYTAQHTKELLPKMKENYERLLTDNPEFEVKLFDNNDCLEFIKNNFSDEILKAYNSLIPQSYKSDLWRYCVMYLNGGIYIDIKFKCVNGFKLIALIFIIPENPQDFLWYYYEYFMIMYDHKIFEDMPNNTKNDTCVILLL